MKILITTDAYAPMINGVVISIMNLKEQLELRGHEVRIVALSPDRKARKDGSVYFLPSIGVPVYPDARATFSFRGKYIKELLAWKPDLVHSQSEFTSFHVAHKLSKKLKIPMIHTYHTMYEDYTHYFIPSERIGKLVVANAVHFLLRKMDVIVTPTPKVSAALRNYGLKCRMVSIPTGIDLSRFYEQLSEETRDKLRSDLGYQKGDKVLLFVGRVGKEKNINLVVQTLEPLLKERTDYKMLIVGDGPHKKELEALVAELGLSESIHFTGAVLPERVAVYYKIADAFVNASQSETQGLTYIEALASGLPAICREDEAIADVIRPEYNGYMFRTGEELLMDVKKLFEDGHYNVMANNARESVKQFSKTVFGERMEKLYEFTLHVQEKGGV